MCQDTAVVKKEKNTCKTKRILYGVCTVYGGLKGQKGQKDNNTLSQP